MSDSEAHSRKIAIIGMGYVGLPLAIALSEIYPVTGFDNSSSIIKQLQSGVLPPGLDSPAASMQQVKHLDYTDDPTQLRKADIIIICVPTPVHEDHTPDFSALENACQITGEHLKDGATVIFESTVSPGTTEERCVPILEKASDKVWKRDFFVGYSPERINPLDKKHTLYNITKLVAGDTPETAQRLKALYSQICPVHVVSQIRVAEASKMLENIQRDVNIALANEMALLCQRLDIPTREVIEAASTKWNFAPYFPGMVGGHCISVDPYYLIEEAKRHGFSTDVISAARARNEGLARELAEMALALLPEEAAREVVILGISYKANASDTRNSKTLELIRHLNDAGIVSHAHDPYAAHNSLLDWEALPVCPMLVITVSHAQYQRLTPAEIMSKVSTDGIIMDIPSLLNPADFAGLPVTIWQL